MRLEMVSVQLDKARQEIVAVEVQAGARGAALADLGDAPVLDRHASRKDAVGGDDQRVANDERVAFEELHALSLRACRGRLRP